MVSQISDFLFFLFFLLVCLCANGQQVELKECRLMLAEERRARLKAESKLMEVNFVLLGQTRHSFIHLTFVFCILLLGRIEICLQSGKIMFLT